MKNDLELYECKKCGSLIEKLIDYKCDNCGIMCCGENMEKAQLSRDGSAEKHIPKYVRAEDEIVVNVGNEEHPMDKEHYIMWICLVTDHIIKRVQLYPEQDTTVRFKYIPKSTIYAYCNKHGLWAKEVD